MVESIDRDHMTANPLTPPGNDNHQTQLDAVVQQSPHSAGDPEVLGLVPGVIDAAGPAMTQSSIPATRKSPEATGMYGTG